MFQETRMGEMASLWNYVEHQEMEEMRRSKDYVRQLIHLLKVAIQERDDYRSQLHLLRWQLPDRKNSPARAASNSFSDAAPAVDHGTLVLDHLARGRALPAKGRLVQAVIDAGPLLLAGPLPRWRTPPQLHPFQIPPVSIRSSHALYCSNNPQILFANNNGCDPMMKRARFC